MSQSSEAAAAEAQGRTGGCPLASVDVASLVPMREAIERACAGLSLADSVVRSQEVLYSFCNDCMSVKPALYILQSSFSQHAKFFAAITISNRVTNFGSASFPEAQDYLESLLMIYKRQFTENRQLFWFRKLTQAVATLIKFVYFNDSNIINIVIGFDAPPFAGLSPEMSAYLGSELIDVFGDESTSCTWTSHFHTKLNFRRSDIIRLLKWAVAVFTATERSLDELVTSGCRQYLIQIIEKAAFRWDYNDERSSERLDPEKDLSVFERSDLIRKSIPEHVYNPVMTDEVLTFMFKTIMMSQDAQLIDCGCRVLIAFVSSFEPRYTSLHHISIDFLIRIYKDRISQTSIFCENGTFTFTIIQLAIRLIGQFSGERDLNRFESLLLVMLDITSSAFGQISEKETLAINLQRMLIQFWSFIATRLLTPAKDEKVQSVLASLLKNASTTIMDGILNRHLEHHLKMIEDYQSDSQEPLWISFKEYFVDLAWILRCSIEPTYNFLHYNLSQSVNSLERICWMCTLTSHFLADDPDSEQIPDAINQNNTFLDLCHSLASRVAEVVNSCLPIVPKESARCLAWCAARIFLFYTVPTDLFIRTLDCAIRCGLFDCAAQYLKSIAFDSQTALVIRQNANPLMSRLLNDGAPPALVFPAYYNLTGNGGIVILETYFRAILMDFIDMRRFTKSILILDGLAKSINLRNKVVLFRSFVIFLKIFVATAPLDYFQNCGRLGEIDRCDDPDSDDCLDHLCYLRFFSLLRCAANGLPHASPMDSYALDFLGIAEMLVKRYVDSASYYLSHGSSVALGLLTVEIMEAGFFGSPVICQSLHMIMAVLTSAINSGTHVDASYVEHIFAFALAFYRISDFVSCAKLLSALISIFTKDLVDGAYAEKQLPKILELSGGLPLTDTWEVCKRAEQVMELALRLLPQRVLLRDFAFSLRNLMHLNFLDVLDGIHAVCPALSRGLAGVALYKIHNDSEYMPIFENLYIEAVSKCTSASGKGFLRWQKKQT